MASQFSSIGSRVAKQSGFNTVLQSSRDIKILFLLRSVRMYAYGASFLVLIEFLAQLTFGGSSIGLFMALTLLGDASISFLLTLITDKVGRRRVLSVGALQMVMSGVVFSLSSNYLFLLLAAVVGVISPRFVFFCFLPSFLSTLFHLIEIELKYLFMSVGMKADPFEL